MSGEQLAANWLRKALAQTASPDYAGAALGELNAVATKLMHLFEETNFSPIEPSILQPADLLFELYGEDVWERALVLEDGHSRGWCLRPDYTAPVVRAHLASAEPSSEARYCYAGPVFLSAPDERGGGLQYRQAGVEIIGRQDELSTDAEALDLSLRALKSAGLKKFETCVGDLSIAFSLLDAIEMPEAWRTRLKRHFRRRDRFDGLLAELSEAQSEPDGRLAFLKSLGALGREEAVAAVAEYVVQSETPHIGVRTPREIATRFLSLAEDAQAHPLGAAQAELIQAVLSVSTTLDKAPDAFRKLFAKAKLGISDALAARLDAMEARNTAISERGVDLSALAFRADFGRNLEYYHGFVFEMTAPGLEGREGRLGGGGRYDGLFNALDPEAKLMGVGAALRPEAIVRALKMEGGA